MAYFKIGDVDFSMYVNTLKVNKIKKYNAQSNAAGNTVVDYINTKRQLEVGIIPLDDAAMAALQTAISPLSVSITYRNPDTNGLETINCLMPSDAVEYYTIQTDKVMYKAFTLNFEEL